jgi:hypothetical protein
MDVSLLRTFGRTHEVYRGCRPIEEVSLQCPPVQRLVEDGLAEALPCVLLTAKGMPDLATRVFLHKLKRLFSHLPIFGEATRSSKTCCVHFAIAAIYTWYVWWPVLQAWWIGIRQAPISLQCTNLAAAAQVLRASGVMCIGLDRQRSLMCNKSDFHVGSPWCYLRLLLTLMRPQCAGMQCQI